MQKYVGFSTYGDLYTVAEFKELCSDGMVTDDDGYGDFVRDNKVVTSEYKLGSVRPSISKYIPEGITHILWYNK